MADSSNATGRETALAALRMLLAIAWADGRVERAEKRELVRAARSLGLDPVRTLVFLEEVEDDEPVMVEDVLGTELRRSDISELLDLARSVAAADGRVDPRERATIARLAAHLLPTPRSPVR